MKKLLILSFALMLLLSACTPAAPQQTDPTPTTTEAPTEDDTVQVHPERQICSVPTNAKQNVYFYKVVNGQKLKMLFTPPTNKVYEKAPVIINIPGGGWASADINAYHRILDMQYADIYASGFATVTIDYRLISDGVTLVELISDCMDALRFLSCYSDVLEIDTDNVITFGHSAGGHLALMLAYAPHEMFDEDKYWSEYDFNVVGTFPMSAPTILYAETEGPFGGYHSNGTKTAPAAFLTQEMRQTCSPINYVGNGGVPCKFLMGDSDPLVSPVSAQKFANACIAGGVPFEIVWFENGNHGFTSDNGKPVSPNYDTVRSTIVEFAESCLQLDK